MIGLRIMRSEEIDQVAEALSNAQREVNDPERRSTVSVKTRKGGTYSFKYATFNQGLDIFRKVFAKHGLSFMQGSAVVEGNVYVDTFIMHSSGQYLATLWPVAGYDDSDPQASGSAFTYAKRYALFAAMGINGDDDDDGNRAAGNSYKEKDDRKDDKPKAKPNPYDRLFDEDVWEIPVGDDPSEHGFIEEFFRYAERAQNGDEVIRLVGDNKDMLSDMKKANREEFLARLDKEFDSIDDGTGLPNDLRKLLSY